MEIKQITNEQEWEGFVGKQEQTSVLQSWHWREFLQAEGRSPLAFFVIHNGEILAALLVSKLAFPGNKYYLYAPRGPVFKNGLTVEIREKVLRQIPEGLIKIEQFKDTIFLRCDPAVPAQDINFHQVGFQKANKEPQPRQTVILDLTPEESDLLKQMKPKARYNLRLAERYGLQVMHGRGEQDLESFYTLLTKTGERNSFFAHPRGYYFNLWRQLPADVFRLYLAEYQGKFVGGIMVVSYGSQAIYLHGASDYESRSLMSPYLLQWQAIKDAKARGCLTYDLWGVAPRESLNHPWLGITRFKEGFGGKYVEYVGAYDYIYRPNWYRIFNVTRNVRRKFK